MPDMTAIGGALSALKGLKELGEAMIGLRDAKAVEAKRLEFQGILIDAREKILGAQEERAALLEEVASLKAELAAMEGLATERDRYELTEVVKSLFVYRLREDRKHPGEPAHMLCVPCFDEGKRAILQGQHILHCQRCKARLNLGTAPIVSRGRYRSALYP